MQWCFRVLWSGLAISYTRGFHFCYGCVCATEIGGGGLGVLLVVVRWRFGKLAFVFP